MPLRGTLTRHPYAAPLRGQAGLLGPLTRVPLRAPLTRTPYARPLRATLTRDSRAQPLRGMVEPLAGVFQRGSHDLISNLSKEVLKPLFPTRMAVSDLLGVPGTSGPWRAHKSSK